jgi:hypothetical protein
MYAEPIRVEYSAPSTCPGEDEFLTEVRARTARGDGRVTFVVTVTETTGHLVVRTVDGETERDVDGDTCAEVVAALSLIAALTIDPSAAPTPAPPPSVVTREALPLIVIERPRWRWGASVDAGISAGLAPNAIVGVPVSLHAIAPQAFSVHLGFERAASGSIDVTGGAATFTWTVATLEGCPHRWTWRGVSAEPCLRVEGGALQSRGERIVPAREDTHGWFALGAVGRAEWLFAGPAFVELDAGLRAPFTRTTYFFEPNTTIYRAAAVSGLAVAGVGVRFP